MNRSQQAVAQALKVLSGVAAHAPSRQAIAAAPNTEAIQSQFEALHGALRDESYSELLQAKRDLADGLRLVHGRLGNVISSMAVLGQDTKAMAKLQGQVVKLMASLALTGEVVDSNKDGVGGDHEADSDDESAELDLGLDVAQEEGDELFDDNASFDAAMQKAMREGGVGGKAGEGQEESADVAVEDGESGEDDDEDAGSTGDEGTSGEEGGLLDDLLGDSGESQDEPEAGTQGDDSEEAESFLDTEDSDNPVSDEAPAEQNQADEAQPTEDGEVSDNNGADFFDGAAGDEDDEEDDNDFFRGAVDSEGRPLEAEEEEESQNTAHSGVQYLGVAYHAGQPCLVVASDAHLEYWSTSQTEGRVAVAGAGLNIDVVDSALQELAATAGDAGVSIALDGLLNTNRAVVVARYPR